MIALKQVLVATDFSAPADVALTYGRGLARVFAASLTALHVFDNDFLKPMVADPRDVEEATVRRLHDRLTDEDRRQLHARAVTDRSSPPADAIVAYAKRHCADVIVTGTHGRGGMSHLLLGSVAERVVRSAPCPVLTVRHPEREFVRGDGAMILLKNVLVATDFGEAADAALNYGRELARAFHATLHVLHVTDNMYLRNLGGEAYLGALPTDLQRTVNEAAQKRLDELAIDDDPRRARPLAVVRTSPSPALEIARYAKDEAIDLIVMGTHGRGALAHIFMGSVAERVVRIAPCPVLTVRHPEHEFVLPDALATVARA